MKLLRISISGLLGLSMLLAGCGGDQLIETTKPEPALLVTTLPTESVMRETTPTLPPVDETYSPALPVETAIPFSGTSLATAKLSSPASAFVADTDRMRKFAADFKAFLEENRPGTEAFSFVFQDVKSGERFSYNENYRYLAASCMKVGMAMSLAKLVHHGLLSWDTLIPSEVDPKQYIYSEAELAAFGEAARLRDLVIPALRYSNNTATSILFNYTLKNGKYMHYFMDEAFGMHYAADVTMSAFEGIHLMEQLVNNPEEIPEYEFVLDQLRNSTWNSYLTRDLPKEICANKYGQYDAVQHEIGAIFGEKTLIYAAFSEFMNNSEFYPALGRFIYEWQQNN